MQSIIFEFWILYMYFSRSRTTLPAVAWARSRRRGTSQWATSSYSQPGSQTQVLKDITVDYLLVQSARLSDSGIEGGRHSGLPPRTVSQAHRLRYRKGISQWATSSYSQTGSQRLQCMPRKVLGEFGSIVCVQRDIYG